MSVLIRIDFCKQRVFYKISISNDAMYLYEMFPFVFTSVSARSIIESMVAVYHNHNNLTPSYTFLFYFSALLLESFIAKEGIDTFPKTGEIYLVDIYT